MKALTLVTLISCVTVRGAPGGAQMIRGRVFLPDSSTPAAGIVVVVTGPGGVNVTAARALSTTIGDYALHLKAAGRYELRALRIGFRPIVARVDVAPGATTVQDIILSSLPVVIAGMDVRGDGDCALKGRDGQTFLQLWEQARGALAATQLWEESGALDVQLIRVDGHMDAPVSYWDSVFAVVDTLSARESAVDRSFAATPPETLAVRGYVRMKEGGRTVYDMPNAETLLSDQFVGGHCFSIRSSGEHKDWIGFGFTPRETAKDIPDIRGVLWLERSTAELRRLEFEYVNLAPVEYPMCDLHPFIRITPSMLEQMPPFKVPEPRCEHAKNDRSNKLGLGGYADFVRLPSGEWLVANWMLRTPPDEGRFRVLPWRVRVIHRVTERCFQGPNCFFLSAMHARLVTAFGSISRVARDGVELYRSDSGAALMSAMTAKRAGDHPGYLEGIVTDLAGRPLVNAVVQTDDPGRVAVTDSAGVFRLRMLPPATIKVSVRCRGFQPIAFRLAILRDSTRQATLALQPDTARSASTNCAVNKS